MVVIGRLLPRPIPILVRNRFYLSTPRNIGRGRYQLIPATTNSNSGSLSILSLPRNIGRGCYRSVMTQTDFNSDRPLLHKIQCLGKGNQVYYFLMLMLMGCTLQVPVMEPIWYLC